jgi:hypothetical protein
MARIPGVNPSNAEHYAARVFDAQTRTWGSPLANHLVYARRPTIFRGVRGMWAGLDQSGLLSTQLVALLNRRVAALNACEF